MNKNIPSLNGLRAVSIIMVVGYHLNQYGHLTDVKLIYYINSLIFNGPLGVGVFFIISGFLITTLLINEYKDFGTISFENFYIRRIIRIFPAYYFLLFVYLLLQLSGHLYLSKLDWIASLTFTKQFFVGAEDVGHFWSLSVEEFFYFAWPFVFYKTKRFNNAAIFPAIVIVVITRMIFYKSGLIMNTIFSTGDALLIGCLFAIHYKSISSWMGNKKYLIYLCVVFLFSSVLANKYTSYILLNSQDKPIIKFVASVCYGLFGNIGLFTNLAIAFIIIFSINEINNLWFKFLNSKIMNHIGKLSYSIYLWQPLFLSSKILSKLPLLIMLACIYGVSCASYYLIEKQFLKFKKRFSTSYTNQLDAGISRA